MSATEIPDECAACGKTGDGLKKCAACKQVKYCSRACQSAHRPSHKRACKKRAAELFDEALFKEPPPRDDCSICMLVLPFAANERHYQPCCGAVVCIGCMYTVAVTGESRECPFCRKSAAESEEEAVENYKRRAEADDPNALYALGSFYRSGELGGLRDINKTHELWQRAAGLGLMDAYGSLSDLYTNGEGVDVDVKKATHYWELAAMGGDVLSRYNLGLLEMKRYNMSRGIKHFMIAARGGYDNAMKDVTKLREYIDKDEYEETVRAHKKAVDEVKSGQRDRAAEWQRNFR